MCKYPNAPLTWSKYLSVNYEKRIVAAILCAVQECDATMLPL